MTDFRTLCAELTNQLHQYAEVFPEHKIEPLVEHARAALAQSEPEGPTDEEILALSQEHEVSYTMCNGGVIYAKHDGYDMRDDVLSFTRAALARWGK